MSGMWNFSNLEFKILAYIRWMKFLLNFAINNQDLHLGIAGHYVCYTSILLNSYIFFFLMPHSRFSYLIEAVVWHVDWDKLESELYMGLLSFVGMPFYSYDFIFT